VYIRNSNNIEKTKAGIKKTLNLGLYFQTLDLTKKKGFAKP